MAPASPIHASIQNELGGLLRNHLAEQGGRCRAYATPGILLGARVDRNFRIPDIAVSCSPLVPGEPALPDPVLLVEILSPSNPADTWINAWEYTTIPSVQEILVIRTDTIGAQLLRRNPDGRWPNVPLAAERGELVLESVGFRVALDALFVGTWLIEAPPAPPS